VSTGARCSWPLRARSRNARALAASGELFDGYNAEMEAVHDENAALLRASSMHRLARPARLWR
jgi:hypothetical protein